ncbi:hypothetical protein [Lutibacter citreus]|uniref:hypothetical protein n=1 Tax=Lutibacter citreus TaxID=2138210 RepID=UPI000DBE5178|nr:hypothetical protein [Lutibacter citreus]
MLTEILYNSNMHFEHQLWKRELAFWKDELNFLNIKLSELVTRWTNKEVLDKLEYYQNEFIVHGGIMEDINEAITVHETHVAEEQDNIGLNEQDIKMIKKHIELRNSLETQRQIYSDLKKEFFKFLEEFM